MPRKPGVLNLLLDFLCRGATAGTAGTASARIIPSFVEFLIALLEDLEDLDPVDDRSMSDFFSICESESYEVRCFFPTCAACAFSL